MRGALPAAILRPTDPWPLFDEVYDFAGTKTGGQPYYKLPGRRRVPNLRSIPGTTFTRATTAIVPDADGTLRETASGEPAIGRGRGMGFWPAIQNVCTGANFPGAASPTPGVPFSGAVVTLVARADLPAPVLAALDARDPRGLVTHVWRMTGVTHPFGINIEGASAGAGQQTFSAFTHVVSGGFQIGSSSNEGVVGCSTNFERSAAVNVTIGGARTLRLRSTQDNSEVYWFGHVSTATAYLSPVIAVAGAAATRNADAHVRTGLALNPAGFVVYDEGTFEARLQNSYAYEISNGSSERFLFQSNSADSARGVVITGGNTYNFIGPTLSTSTKVKSIMRWNGAVWDLFVNGVKYANGSATFLPNTNSLNLGQRSSGQDTRKGAQSVFAIRNRPDLTDAECIALTTL